jgi:hypothetical protein
MAVSARYCGKCGAARVAVDDEYCRNCGASLGLSGPAQNGAPPAPTILAPPRIAATPSRISTVPVWDASPAPRLRPLWLVAALTVVSYGLYLPIWLGLSWAEMKRELRDPHMQPVGHALAMLVPIYNLCLLHAHFGTINEMLESKGQAAGMSPGAIVATTIGSTLLGGAAARVAQPLTSLGLSLAGLALLGWAVLCGQEGLNDYWRVAAKLDLSEQVHWGEWTTLVAGGLLFALMLLSALVRVSR